MNELNHTEQKALKIAEIAARLVQASANPDNTTLESVLATFDKAFRHVKFALEYDDK